MTRRFISNPAQLNLLDWEPPVPVRAFEEAAVRAPTMSGRLARAIAVALDDAVDGRGSIAERMSRYLGGSPISVNMLNAYASQARETHTISVPRFVALAHATQDARLVELIAAPLGLAAIDRRYLPHIEIAVVADRQEELRRHGERLRRQARAGRWS